MTVAKLSRWDGRPPDSLAAASEGIQAKMLAAFQSAGIERGNWDSSFYDQGGTSLSFVGLVLELTSGLDEEVSLNAVRPDGPLRELVDRVLGISAQASADRDAASCDEGVDPAYSHPNRAWHLRLGPDDDSWNSVSDFYRVALPFDTDVLKRCVTLLVDTHDALRMRIERTGSAVRERYDGPRDILDIVCSQSLPDSEDHLHFATASAIRLRKTISSHSRPFRVLVLPHSDHGGFDIFFAYHHAVIDRLSKRNVEGSFFRNYARLAQGKEPVATSSVDYRGYCTEYAQRCESVRDEALSYWSGRQLDRVPPLKLSQPGHAQDLDERWTEEVSICIPLDEVRALTGKGAEAGVQLSEIVLSAVSSAYSEWSGESELVLALAHHGRTLGRIPTNQTVGWLTDILPLHLINGDRRLTVVDIRDQIEHVDRARAYNYFRHSKGAYFGDHAWPDISLNMILDASLSVSNYPDFVSDYIRREKLKERHPSTRRVHQISGGAVLSEAGLTLSWDFNGRALDRATMADFLSLCETRVTCTDWLGEGESPA